MMGVSTEFTSRCWLWATAILEGTPKYFPQRWIQGLVEVDIFISDLEYKVKVEIIFLVCRWYNKLVNQQQLGNSLSSQLIVGVKKIYKVTVTKVHNNRYAEGVNDYIFLKTLLLQAFSECLLMCQAPLQVLGIIQ